MTAPLKNSFFLCTIRLLCLLATILFFFPTQGQALPQPMQPPRMVNDFAELLNEAERNSLEETLRAYEQDTSTQIYIVTVKNLEKMSALDFATALGNSWGVGQQSLDNGIILLIKPKTDNGKGEVAIALGQGIEKFITNQEAQRIIDNSLIPLFKKGLFAEGLQQTVTTFELLLKNAFSAPADFKQPHSASVATEEGSQPPILFYVLAGLFVLMLIVMVLTGHADTAGKICLWLFALIGAIFSLALIFGGSRGSSGSSGGGFKGGGGGSFKGGGASGSW